MAIAGSPRVPLSLTTSYPRVTRMPEATPEQPAAGNPEPEGSQAKAPQAQKPKPEKAPRSGGMSGLLLLAGVAIGALALGGLTGGFLIGPRLVAMRGGEPAGAHQDEQAAESEEPGHTEGGAAHPVAFKVDNIIVNPAGSEGTRFLMASVTFELQDEKVAERLRERDFVVRDAVISVLENQTLEALTRPGARDSLKRRLAEAVRPFAGSRKLSVFLPQFVIQ